MREEIKGKPPAWLSDTGQSCWSHLSGILTITPENRETLAIICENYAVYRSCVEILRKEGLTYTTDSGHPKPHPAVGIKKSAQDTVTKLLELLLKKNPDTPIDDPLSDFLGGS